MSGELRRDRRPPAAASPTRIPGRRACLVPEGKDARYRESQLATLTMTRSCSTTRALPIVAGTDAICRDSLCIASWSCTRRRASARRMSCVHRDARRSARRAQRPGARLDHAGQARRPVVLVDGDPAKRIGDVRRTVSRHQGRRFLRAGGALQSAGCKAIDCVGRRAPGTRPLDDSFLLVASRRGACQMFSKNRIDDRVVRGGGSSRAV